jgi:hypothetical protein
MRKSALVASLILMLAGAIASVPASAQSVLYDNITPSSYVTGSWEIWGSYNVIDSFTLTQNATVTGVEFGEDTSEDYGDSPEGVYWSISAGPSPTPVFAEAATLAYPSSSEISSGTPSGFTYNGGGASNFGVWSESFSVPDLSLPAGTYWLQLQYAIEAGGYAGWDISSGGSQGELFEDGTNFVESIPSETFEVLGTPTTVPEGGSGWMYLLLAGGGLALAFGARIAAGRKAW